MAVMDRVGGYGDLLALEEDARRYEDAVLVLVAESQAAREEARDRDAREALKRRGRR